MRKVIIILYFEHANLYSASIILYNIQKCWYLFVDEGALVKGAKQLGFVFTTRTPDSVIINAVSFAFKCNSWFCFETAYSF